MPSTIIPTNPVAPDVDELSDELRIGVARLRRRLLAEGTDVGLGDTLASVLGLIVRNGPRTLRQLADFERVTPPSMNQTMNQLVAAGYVRREEDPSDGRKVLFVATDGGVGVATETRRRRHQWLNARLSELTDDERAVLKDAAGLLYRLSEQ